MTLAKDILKELKATLWQESNADQDSDTGVEQSRQRQGQVNTEEFYALAPVGYFTLSPDGLIQDVNPNGTKLLRTKREQLLRRPFTEFIVKKHRERFRKQLKVCADGQSTRRFELRLKNATGKPCYARVSTWA